MLQIFSGGVRTNKGKFWSKFFKKPERSCKFSFLVAMEINSRGLRTNKRNVRFELFNED